MLLLCVLETAFFTSFTSPSSTLFSKVELWQLWRKGQSKVDRSLSQEKSNVLEQGERNCRNWTPSIVELLLDKIIILVSVLRGIIWELLTCVGQISVGTMWKVEKFTGGRGTSKSHPLAKRYCVHSAFTLWSSSVVKAPVASLEVVLLMISFILSHCSSGQTPANADMKNVGRNMVW